MACEEIPMTGWASAASGCLSSSAHGSPARARADHARQRPSVLACDDDSRTVHALRLLLGEAGFDVVTTATVQSALNLAALRTFDAMILEVLLPDGDGVALCRRLREWSTAGVIMLSSIVVEEQKVRALSAGADDYLTKPFGAGELVARLRAILRRTERELGQPRVELPGLTIDLAGRRVYCHDEEVHLTPIEFRLLCAFVTNQGRLLSHAELLQRAWGAAHEQDRQTLRTHIANLRRKLSTVGDGPLISTRTGVGYRFSYTGDRDAAPRPSVSHQPLGGRSYPRAA